VGVGGGGWGWVGVYIYQPKPAAEEWLSRQPSHPNGYARYKEMLLAWAMHMEGKLQLGYVCVCVCVCVPCIQTLHTYTPYMHAHPTYIHTLHTYTPNIDTLEC
jgi:hypothetical protein